MSPGTPGRERSVWGWGWADAGPGPEYERGIAHALEARYGLQPLTKVDPARTREPGASSVAVRSAGVARAALLGRAARPRRHTYGKSFRDVVRGLRGDFPNPPDVVAYPAHRGGRRRAARLVRQHRRGRHPVRRRLERRRRRRAAAARRHPAVRLARPRPPRSGRRDRSHVARRAHPGGRPRPALEEQLRPHGLTLRHFPQSFEFSTLGGWIATRSGGHYATLYTHIDDFVESLRVVTPSGVVADAPAARLGRRPGPDRLFIGSEGILGVITEAWMRLQDRPTFRASASVTFADFAAGAEAARAIAQAGLYPSNCRLLDPGEAAVSGAGDRRRQRAARRLRVGRSSRSTPGWRARSSAPATTAARRRQTRATTRSTDEGAREGAAGAWRQRVPRRAVSPRRARRARHDQRDLRDRRHVGSLRGASTRR